LKKNKNNFVWLSKNEETKKGNVKEAGRERDSGGVIEP